MLRNRPDQTSEPVQSLDELLDRIESLAEDEETVSIGDVMEALAAKSFAPLLIAPGLLLVPPGPADIPGVPILLGLFVIFISAQLLIGRDHFWIPQWLQRRDVSSDKVSKAISWLRKPADWLDRVTRPRYESLVTGTGKYAIAVICMIISSATPAMSVIPMSSNAAGAAIATFGVAILARDGLVAGTGMSISCGIAVLVAYGLMS